MFPSYPGDIVFCPQKGLGGEVAAELGVLIMYGEYAVTRAPIRDGHFTRSVVVAVGVGAHYKTPTTSPPIPVPVFVFIRGQRGKLGISLIEEYSIFFFTFFPLFAPLWL